MCIRINWITQLNQTEGKGRLRHKRKKHKKGNNSAKCSSPN